MNEAESQFRSAIKSAGLMYPDHIEPGKLYRFPGAGKARGNKAGWCKLFDDCLGGVYGDFSVDLSAHWQAERPQPFTTSEREAFMRRVSESKAQAEAEKQAAQSAAAARAAAIWREAKLAGNHPYLTRKGIQANGARLYRGQLVIALRDGGSICSLQFIDADGDKRFLSYGRKKGCYFSIGTPSGAAALCIAEGFATGATIHEATGLPVAIAFDAGNLESVARALRARLPELSLILCADDDAGTQGNPGLDKATAAAAAVGGGLAIPEFGVIRPEGATDFNDMAKHCGAEAVKRVISGASVPAVPMHQLESIKGAANDLEGWPDPLPLPNALPAVLPFDFDLLPVSLRPWIEDIAERVQCPPDYAAVGAIISLAAVVGRRIGIRPKRQDDWIEVPNLWGAIIGSPGVMKSPALRASMAPLATLEGKAREGYEEARSEWLRGQELHKLKREGAKAKIVQQFKKSADVDPAALPDAFAEEEPRARRYVVNDCSVEALGEILRGNPNGTLAYRDELVGLLKSLDKEGNEGARSFFLTAWSGKDAYVFDRIGRGLDMRIEGCCLSLLGSIQPAVIGGYLRQAVENGGGDGLLSRFQLLVWPDISGDWRNVDRWPDSEAKAAAFATFERLDALDPAAIGATVEGGDIPYLRFESEAQEIFTEWRTSLEARLRSGNEHPAFESHLSKYRKLVPALALLIHLADSTAGAIGTTSILKALAWAEYLQSHARRAYASVAQAQAEGGRALLRRIKNGEIINPFTPRDVYLKHWANLSNPSQAHEAVRFLADLDYLRIEEHATGGRPKAAIWINPKARGA